MKRVALTLVLATATACGTTVSPAGQQALQPGDDGLSPPAATTGPSTTPTAAQPGVLSGTPTSSSFTSTGPTAAAGPTTTGPAVPRGGTIVIGYETHKDGASAVAAVGISGAATGDTDNQMRAIAAAVNARGGILGRKVVLAPHDVRTLESLNNREASDSASCADWLDKKVFAVVNIGLRPVLRSCLGKAGVPIISSVGISTAASVYGNTLPGVYAPSAMSIDRYVSAVIDRLVARRFFTGWDPATGRPGPLPLKIGMQSFSDPDGQHVVAVTRKALAAHGLKLDEVEAHSMSLNDNSASTSGAVLRFRAKGITHVIDANLLFFKGADSQGYHPRYVVQDTINTPALLTKNVGASQLHGSMGAGYLPLYEIDNPPDPSPAATACKALMRKAGEDTTNAVAAALMLHECDAVSFLEQALTAGGAVSASALRAGAASMGAFTSHLTYASRITPARRDGATRVRDFDYVDTCGCFRFSSPTTYPVD